MTAWHPEEDALVDSYILDLLMSENKNHIGAPLPFPQTELRWEWWTQETIVRRWLGLKKELVTRVGLSLFHGDMLLRQWSDDKPVIVCFFEEDNLVHLKPEDYNFLRSSRPGIGLRGTVWPRN